MSIVRIVFALACLALTIVALTMVALASYRLVRIVRLGRADSTRTNLPKKRWATMLRETMGHTRMLKWTGVGAAHWFVFIAFGALLFTLVEAYGELFDTNFQLPIVGTWSLYGLAMEFVAATCGLGIAALIAIRLTARVRARNGSRVSRFAGSVSWQAYFVEWTIVAIVLCVFAIRGFRAARNDLPYAAWATPFSHWLGSWLPDIEAAIVLIAGLKIVVSMAWFIVIAQHLSMGVAWHRFTAFFNIFFKRNADGAPALGALLPMTSQGKPLDFTEADPEHDTFGAGKIEDFSWKGWLDFTTCTECGRCQSQCPAWNTAKPLSPKMLITNLREHALATAPYLLAGRGQNTNSGEKSPDVLSALSEAAKAAHERPLVGAVTDSGVIDPEVLWSCTTCGACVEQCPVDIEHIDHIVDMRRYQVMIEANFPSEAGAMLRNLENKGNPWGASPQSREDWLKALPFEVPVVSPGEPIPKETEYLFWVGCAGAFDDRAKKTTRVVAELLHTADVNFVVLGNGERCSGDPARRIGNEFLYQSLATENVASLNAAFTERESSPQRTIVTTCPHCFNTLGNEYPQLGGEYTVVHHSQVLGKLLEQKRLTPVHSVDEKITYHDPCYLGRHNRIFAPPRDVLGAVPNAELVEMERSKERSFCCGGGGARMWMEEKIGKRINLERSEEAIATQASTVVASCPFCLTMLQDGVADAQTAKGTGDVRVVDMAQVLHESILGAGKSVGSNDEKVGG